MLIDIFRGRGVPSPHHSLDFKRISYWALAASGGKACLRGLMSQLTAEKRPVSLRALDFCERAKIMVIGHVVFFRGCLEVLSIGGKWEGC